MDSLHRIILKKCRNTILEDLIIEPVLQYLFHENIIREEEFDAIIAESISKNKIRKFLEILPRRGPNAYLTFKNGLAQTGQDALAAKLSQMEELYSLNTQSNPSDVTTVSVSVSNDGTDANRTVNHITSPTSSYPMLSRFPGHVLIINNCFNTKAYNNLSSVGNNDVKNLSNIFGLLNYSIQIESNLSKEGIFNLLKKTAYAHDFNDTDSFILIIIGHGVERMSVLGNDELPLELPDIFSEFSNTKCDLLRYKPKIFIIVNYVNFFDSIIGDNVDGIPVLDEMRGASSLILQEGKDFKLPNMSDCYFCVCSLSKKQPDSGSSVIASLCQVFREYLIEKNINLHIDDLFIRVNRFLSSNYAEYIDELPKLEPALLKDFYIKPLQS